MDPKGADPSLPLRVGPYERRERLLFPPRAEDLGAAREFKPLQSMETICCKVQKGRLRKAASLKRRELCVTGLK